jgi:hypothetical protein
MNRSDFSARDKKPTIAERRFIAQVLATEGKEILEEQSAAIEKHNLYREGLLSDRRGYSVKGAGSFYSGHLEIHFVKYLRFHDMKRKNNPKAAATILGFEKATRSRRHQYHLYNRIVFGHMNSITNQLMHGFTDEIKSKLSGEYQIPV